MGLKELKRPCDVAVHTDSQYLHNAFTAGWIDKWLKNGWKTSDRKPVQNEDLWRELLAQTQVHAVAWRWVRGHAGDVENGRADELAVAAREALASRLRGG
jgi:ribonuclease HI